MQHSMMLYFGSYYVISLALVALGNAQQHGVVALVVRIISYCSPPMVIKELRSFVIAHTSVTCLFQRTLP